MKKRANSRFGCILEAYDLANGPKKEFVREKLIQCATDPEAPSRREHVTLRADFKEAINLLGQTHGAGRSRVSRKAEAGRS